MTHPHVLTAQTALWALTDALSAIPGVIRAEATTRAKVGPRQPSPRRGPRSLKRLSALIHDERAERIVTTRSGGQPDVAMPAPVRAELLDAPRVAEEALTDSAWIIASSLRHRPLLVYGRVWRLLATREMPAPAGYLRIALPHAAPTIAREVAGILNAADLRVRTATHMPRPLAMLPGNPACPGCGQRMLRVETTAPDRTLWAVVCAARCVCAGDDCPCGMPVRERGCPHVWSIGDVLTVDAA